MLWRKDNYFFDTMVRVEKHNTWISHHFQSTTFLQFQITSLIVMWVTVSVGISESYFHWIQFLLRSVPNNRSLEFGEYDLSGGPQCFIYNFVLFVYLYVLIHFTFSCNLAILWFQEYFDLVFSHNHWTSRAIWETRWKIPQSPFWCPVSGQERQRNTDF